MKWLKRQLDAWLEFALVIVGALTTAALGLALDFAAPHGWYWLGVLVGCLLLFVIVCRRNQVRRERTSRGTLYYLRMLDSSMQDVHRSELLNAVPDHLDMRTVTRWIPPVTAEVRKSGRRIGIDVSDQVHEMARDLEVSMNSDDVTTQFTFGPNLLWPAAMGIGYETILVEGKTSMMEVDRERPRWVLDSPPKSQQAEILDSPFLWTPAGAADDAPILLVLSAGPAQLDLPRAWRALDASRVAQLSLPDQFLLKADDTENNPNPNDVIQACARAIYLTLQQVPSRYVVLATRLPKSLQFALGWRLAQKFECDGDERSKVDPWPRLVTVQIPYPRSPEASDMIVTRVNAAQPPLDKMIKVARFAGFA